MSLFTKTNEFNNSSLHIDLFEHEINKSKFYKVYDQYNTRDCTFSINFYTPSSSSKGIQHIIEHSVLCGSQNYQVKEPFTNLLQSSFQTYLNAGTYQEHTEYPVQSRNTTDFYNLMKVYLDAVFNPLFTQKEEIFLQEGYNEKIASDQVISSGVVYNEMKPVYSDPQQLGLIKFKELIFNQSFLQFDSGGDPDLIEKLTYQELVEYYKKYYSSNNCVIIIHGPSKVEDDLLVLNTFMSNIPSGDKVEKCSFNNHHQDNKSINYPTQDVEAQSFQFIGGHLPQINNLTSLDIQMYKIVNYILFQSESSPITEFFQKEQLSETVEGDIQFEEFYGHFYIMFQGVEPEQISLTDQFKQIIQQCLGIQQGIYYNFISKSLLQSAIQNLKFQILDKSEEYGIDLVAKIASAALYDLHPTFYLDQISLLEELEKMNSENLLLPKLTEIIQGLFLDNTLQTLFLQPSTELYLERQYAHSVHKNQILEENQIQIIQEKKLKLDSYQTSIDSEENLSLLPQLNLDEINIVNMKTDLQRLQHEKITENCVLIDNRDEQIVIMDLFFNISKFITTDTLLLFKILTYLQFNLITTKYKSRKDLQLVLDSTLGEYETGLLYIDNLQDRTTASAFYNVQVKFLQHNCEHALQLIENIFQDFEYSLKSDKEKIITILQDYRSQFESGIQGEDGYDISQRTAQAKFSKSSLLSLYSDGIPMYKFLDQLDFEDDESINTLFTQLIDSSQQLLEIQPVFIIGCDKSMFIKKNLAQQLYQMSFGTANTYKDLLQTFDYTPSKYISTSIDLNFVSASVLISVRNGFWLLLEHILNSIILWDEIRVKRGAYGCSIRSSLQLVLLSSYRDPNTQNTLQFFQNIQNLGSHLREHLTIDKLDKLKIGCFASQQLPSTPSQIYSLIQKNYFSSHTIEDTIIEYDQIFNANIDQVIEAFQYIQGDMENAIFGNSSLIEQFPDAEQI